jgi:deazaflavin-dependent oxidoreductase (nitroreductase family)
LPDFNQPIIDEFRARHGQVGGPFEGGRLLLLTTTGARSGRSHTVPLGYLPDGDGRLLVIGSAGGGPRHPAWYHNLITQPRVIIEAGAFRYPADAVVLSGPERDQAFGRATESDPGWATYQRQTSRQLPVVRLTATPGPPEWTSSSAGETLIAVHDAFRRELALIRREVATAGPTIGAQLRVNCLTVCAGLHHHHTGEDQAIFPMIMDRHPGLGPTIDRLAEEHRQVAALLAELQRVIGDPGAAPDGVAAEVDRLAAELEAHLAYEEEQLVPLLDGVFA